MEKFELNESEVQTLLTAQVGNGGFQSLLKTLGTQYDSRTKTIVLYAKDREHIRKYAFNYGNGGWQKQLLTIFQRVLGSEL